ncbi:MAG: Rieske 2Fe-2S domain-containing protein [Chloroflexi bacterium]|nr:Rieske 2Fe-2S domain-containing protein [Chloroflexota bacterium]
MVAQIRHSHSERSLRHLVDLEHGQISREIYVNDDVYRQEQEQIFARAWLFVGHETLVPNPGDFFQSRMGEEDVLLVRDRKGQIHVFLNTCRHRGMKVCRYDDGNTLVFTCPFHGWTYGTDGQLVAVPNEESTYHGELDKAAWGLHEVAQLCNFYGSIWATWDAGAPSFEDYLGPFSEGIRRCFQSSDGRDNGVEVFKPPYKWYIPTNWKLPAFSFDGDMAHGAMTHQSINTAAIGPQGELGGGGRHGLRAAFPKTEYEFCSAELGHGGHNPIFELPGVPPYVETWQTAPGVDDYYRRTREEQAKRFADQYLHGGGGCVWPNAIVQPQRILLKHPAGVGRTESWRLYPVDKDAPKLVKDAQRRYMMRYGGPAGLTESDDMENWNYASRASLGTIARRLPYNFQMGLGHAFSDDRVPGITLNNRTAEENQRARLRRWVEFMEAGSWDDIYPMKQT